MNNINYNDKRWDPIMHISLYELKKKRTDLADKLVEETSKLSKEESIKHLEIRFNEYREAGILADLAPAEPIIQKLAELDGIEYLKELGNYLKTID